MISFSDFWIICQVIGLSMLKFCYGLKIKYVKNLEPKI